MSITFRTVVRSKNTIRFKDRVNDKALRDFIPALYEVIGRGYTDVVLDFRAVDRAWAEAMLPLICVLDHRRARGNEFRALLPESPHLRQLFLNTNWAHLLDDEHPRLDMQHPQHLPVRRYLTHQEQQEAVESVLDVVLRNLELGRNVIKALDWAVNEVTDNVLNHADSPAGGLVQVTTLRDEHRIQFVVADSGRGVPTAMREAFPRIGGDARALEEAVKAGVTSRPQAGQGNGLAGTLRIARCTRGSFKIASGNAQLNVFRDPRTERWRQRVTPARSGFHFPGTVVLMELRTDTEFDLDEALSLEGMMAGPVADVVDLRYGSDESSDLTIHVMQEGFGVGTRHAGAELRQKALNLLNAEPQRRLVLDWSGFDVVASSFADEAVGKLFLELGPLAFSSRVQFVGVEPLVRSLFDKAVIQRVSQITDGNADNRSSSPGAR